MDGGGSKDIYIRPGVHEVTGLSARYTGPSKSDSTWNKLELVYENVAKKTIKETILVPTSTLEFNTEAGTTTFFCFQKLGRVVAALGMTMGETLDSNGSVLNEMFSQPEKSLVGRPLKVTVGYTGNYLEWLGKSADGQKQYAVKNAKDGSTLAGKDGKTLIFADVDAAKAHCEQNQITVQGFANVLEHAVSASGSSAKAAANW